MEEGKKRSLTHFPGGCNSCIRVRPKPRAPGSPTCVAEIQALGLQHAISMELTEVEQLECKLTAIWKPAWQVVVLPALPWCHTQKGYS